MEMNNKHIVHICLFYCSHMVLTFNKLNTIVIIETVWRILHTMDNIRTRYKVCDIEKKEVYIKGKATIFNGFKAFFLASECVDNFHTWYQGRTYLGIALWLLGLYSSLLFSFFLSFFFFVVVVYISSYNNIKGIFILQMTLKFLYYKFNCVIMKEKNIKSWHWNCLFTSFIYINKYNNIP